MPEFLIDKAKELLSGESIRFEDVIANAEYHRQVAEKERKLAEEAARETTRLRDEAEKLRKQMEEKRETTLRKTREDARRIMEQTRRESESILADLKRLKKNANAPEREAAELKRRLEKDIDSLSEGLKQKVDTVTAPPKTVKIGDEVEILTLNTRGTVLAPPDAKGEVQLQAGIMKLKAHITQLRLVKEEKPKPKTVVHAQTGNMTKAVRTECDIRGMAVDEAIPVVDLFLDDAVLSALNEVSIIHGKGTGVLRQGIQQHLKHHPHVKSYRLGVYGEGESGVTVVTLK